MQEKAGVLGSNSSGSVFWKNYGATTILLLIIIVVLSWIFASGHNMTPEGAPPLTPVLVVSLILAGFLAGWLGGLIGTGGCAIILPAFSFWLGFPTPLAVGTTLFVVIFTAVAGGYGHYIRGNVHLKSVAWLAPFGVAGVLIGSWLFSVLTDKTALISLILGLVFIFPAARMIWEGVFQEKLDNKAKTMLMQRGIEEVSDTSLDLSTLEDKKLEIREITGLDSSSISPETEPELIPSRPLGMSSFGFLVGTLTGLVGMGGGYLLVPGLIYLFSAPVYITMGTSLAAVLPIAVVGGTIKLVQGFVALEAALIAAAGTIIGAQIAAATIKKYKPATLKIMFGIYFLYAALKFIFAYFGIHVF